MAAGRHVPAHRADVQRSVTGAEDQHLDVERRHRTIRTHFATMPLLPRVCNKRIADVTLRGACDREARSAQCSCGRPLWITNHNLYMHSAVGRLSHASWYQHRQECVPWPYTAPA